MSHLLYKLPCSQKNMARCYFIVCKFSHDYFQQIGALLWEYKEKQWIVQHWAVMAGMQQKDIYEKWKKKNVNSWEISFYLELLADVGRDLVEYNQLKQSTARLICITDSAWSQEKLGPGISQCLTHYHKGGSCPEFVQKSMGFQLLPYGDMNKGRTAVRIWVWLCNTEGYICM